MSSQFVLNCLVLGQYYSNRFKINIKSTESVESFTNVIKQTIGYQGTVEDVAVSFVDIAVPNVGGDIEAFRSFERAVWQARTRPSQSLSLKLSEIFRDKFNDRNLHVVVDVPQLAIPPLKLVCIVQSESIDLSDVFIVSVDRRETVSSLEKAIIEMVALRGDILNRKFKIWSVSIPVDDSFEEKVKKLDFSQELMDLDQLSVCFPVKPSVRSLHIVVEGLKAEMEYEEKRDSIAALTRRFSIALATISKATAPGELAEAFGSQFQSCFCDGRYRAKNPRITVAPPVQLFHPIFAHFLDRIKANDEIPDDITAKVTTYMRKATAVYDKAADRRNHLEPILGALLDIDIQLITNYDNTCPDRVLELNTTLGNFAILLVQEDNNEFGRGHSDSSTQIGFSMARSWIQSRFESIRNRTCCPTFLIANAGPWIAVLGAVFTDMVIIQSLTDYVWVGFDSALNDEHCERVARVFSSLRECLARLKCYYNELGPAVNPPVEDSRFFPAINAYRDDDGKIVTFEYKGFLENDSCCVTLLAERRKETVTKGLKKQRIQEIEKVVVKFVDRYGKEPHELLAKVQRAPKLYYCGKPGLDKQDPTYDNIRMVVMEYIDGMTVSEAVTTFGLDHVKAGLEDSLHVLHDDNRVFGDFRLPNIIVTKEGRVKLIDFDWAGDHGRTRYPILMSEMIQWPKGVGAAAIMKKEHDIEMMKKLLHKFDGRI